MRMRRRVRTSYSLREYFGRETSMDAAAMHAVGRPPDFSGSGFYERDLGWFCDGEVEQQRVARALRKIGLAPVVEGEV